MPSCAGGESLKILAPPRFEPRVHDIEVDEKEAPIGAATVRERCWRCIDLTLPYGRGSDWSTPYARILSIGRHLRKALAYVSRTLESPTAPSATVFGDTLVRYFRSWMNCFAQRLPEPPGFRKAPIFRAVSSVG